MTKSPAGHKDGERRHHAAPHRGAFLLQNSPRASLETSLGTRARIWHPCSCPPRAATTQGMPRIPQHPALLSTTGGHRAPMPSSAHGANPSTRTPKTAPPQRCCCFSFRCLPSKIKAQTSDYLGIFSPAITHRLEKPTGNFPDHGKRGRRALIAPRGLLPQGPTYPTRAGTPRRGWPRRC